MKLGDVQILVSTQFDRLQVEARLRTTPDMDESPRSFIVFRPGAHGQPDHHDLIWALRKLCQNLGQTLEIQHPGNTAL